MAAAAAGRRPRLRRGRGRAALALLLWGPGAAGRAAAEAAAPVEASLPRGVGPLDAERYAAALSGAGDFRCLDGSGEALPAAAVNDDFCDCADGTDEPGTAACAGQEGQGDQKEVFFFCANAAAQPRYLYRSRVNDGICDCCDGSDEWRTGACSDTCFEDGRAFREAEHRRIQAWEQGTELQRRLTDESSNNLQTWRSELDSLRAALPDLERESKEKKKRLEEAKANLPAEPEVLDSPSPPAEETPEDAAARLRELEAVLDPGLKGERRALAALRGECKVRSVEKFSYKLCFFREASQTYGKDNGDSGSVVSLGHWAGWDFSVDPPEARFEGGSECPGGQRRKLTVSFKCSSKAKLKAVSEPGACVYSAEVLHPGACDDSRAPEDSAEEETREKWAKVLSTQKELLEAVDRELDSWRSEKTDLEAKLGATKGAEPTGSPPPAPAPDAVTGAGEGGEQPKISEYAKWMEGGSAGAGAGGGDAAPSTATTTAAAAAEAPAPPEPAAAPEAAESPERKAHREAEASWSEANTAARETKHRIWGLEARLHPSLTGGLLALGSLADECLEKTADKFTYKVCFFRHAYQDTDSVKGVSLGRWIGWDFSGDGPRGRFGRGAACGNGVRRSLTVSFACGEKASIETVNEKEACVYEAEVLHPAACDASLRPEKKTLPALMPRDEL